MAPAVASTNWWVRWPGLHADELAAYAEHGATVVSETKRRGLLLLDVDWPGQDGPVRLRIGYSPLHPFCRPAVAAPGLSLERHKNPFNHALCLLTQESGQWNANDLVADMIGRQLPQIHAAVEARRAGDGDLAAALEEQAADPITTYYADSAEDSSAVFFDGDQKIPPFNYGTAVFLAHDRTVVSVPRPFDAVLSRVMPASGAWLAPAFDLPQRIVGAQEVMGRWVRLEGPLPKDPAKLLALADEEISRRIGPDASLRARMRTIADVPLAITAILLREELAYGQHGDGWLFAVSRAGAGKRRNVTLVAGHRVSDDMFSRLPIASALRGKKALLVGCGAIGAFVVVELARAGVEAVTFADYDLLEPGNSVRWPLGRSAWGLSKTVALQEFLVRNYPYTRAIAMSGKVGAATTDLTEAGQIKESPVAMLSREIEAADVVIDASASTECQHALAYLARAAGKPLVVGYGTLGAAGGVVARFPIDSPACLVCLSEHWADGALPQPAVDEDGEVLPVGCNAPTFAGGAFDLQEVSLEIVRSAIGLMVPEAFDAGDWQLSTLTLREDGRRVLPRWTADALSPHPRCRCSGA
jgi:hypothetical protein